MTNTQDTLTVNRNQKARVFEMVFRDKKALLELYNAVNGTAYTDPEKLQINTLENAIYMTMQNDISFIIDSRLTLYEHQSTYCPNLPLRFLNYVKDLYSEITKDMNLYGTRLIKIPTPRFVIFYNGDRECPDMMEFKLSDSFLIAEEEPALELRAIMLNINPGHNQELMAACKTLRDYSEYTYRVRTYAQTMDIGKAVHKAIKECIDQGILAEFLSKNQAEAISMSIYEYDQKKHIQMERDEAREEGRQEGLVEGREEGRQEGREEERTNTERERLRAEAAEAEVERLRRELAKLQ